VFLSLLFRLFLHLHTLLYMVLHSVSGGISTALCLHLCPSSAFAPAISMRSGLPTCALPPSSAMSSCKHLVAFGCYCLCTILEEGGGPSYTYYPLFCLLWRTILLCSTLSSSVSGGWDVEREVLRWLLPLFSACACILGLIPSGVLSSATSACLLFLSAASACYTSCTLRGLSFGVPCLLLPCGRPFSFYTSVTCLLYSLGNYTIWNY